MGLAAFASPADATCRLALLLALDVSMSVDATDFGIQRKGLLAALEDPVIQKAFLKPKEPVALAVFEWSGRSYQYTIVDWVMIKTPADLSAVSDTIALHDRGGEGMPTGLGSALLYAHEMFTQAPDCVSRTLDVSGDGRNNDGINPAHAYARVDYGGILVNALAIGGHEADIEQYYRNEVLRGPGAFVEPADRHTDFPRAIRRKLERELTEQAIGQLPTAERGG